MLKEYQDHGYTVIRNVIPTTWINNLKSSFLEQYNNVFEEDLKFFKNEKIAKDLNNFRTKQTELYDKLQKNTILLEFGKIKEIISPVKKILGNNIGLFQKIPFRVDAPLEVSELALWHQDYHYVKGNTDILTVWVPLQDTPYSLGCLSVMPGSHKLGIIPHTKNILRKKNIPLGIYDKFYKFCEMKEGDILLFNALLLHSSNLNISNSVRLSVQLRYSHLNKETDPSMGFLHKL